MNENKLANMLGFNSVDEMELYHKTCELGGESQTKSLTKSQCLEFINKFALEQELVKLQNMTKEERLVYTIKSLSVALEEPLSAENYSGMIAISSLISSNIVELQQYSSKKLADSYHFKL